VERSLIKHEDTWDAVRGAAFYQEHPFPLRCRLGAPDGAARIASRYFCRQI
jgi:hypothetical protein